MDRNLTLNLVRVTEAAAIRSSYFLGKGDKNGADGAAMAERQKWKIIQKGRPVLG